MSKIKILSIVSAFLLVVNLALVGFFLFNKPNHKNHHGPRDLIIEKLNFNNQQVAAYDKLIHWHRAEINKAEDAILLTKTKLYKTVITQNNHDSLLQELGSMQIKIEEIHLKHFNDLKNLCTEAQQPLFEKLTDEIAALFQHKRKPPIK